MGQKSIYQNVFLSQVITIPLKGKVEATGKAGEVNEMCDCKRFEVKTDYSTGIATQVCQDCGEVKEVPGTFMSVLDNIRTKKLQFRSRTKREYGENYLAQGAQWKAKGKLEKR